MVMQAAQIETFNQINLVNMQCTPFAQVLVRKIFEIKQNGGSGLFIFYIDTFFFVGIENEQPVLSEFSL